MPENDFVEVNPDNILVNRLEIEPRFNLIEISYKDELKGIDAHGRLFVSDNGKLEFEGDVEESARVFFEECLKPMCEKYLDLLNEKIKYPLFFLKEN